MRRALPAVLLVAGLGLVVAWTWSPGDGRGTDRPAHARTGSAGRSGAAAADTGFADLSRATSSRCDLQADDIMRLPDTQRLQGSCCSPMQRDAYRRQVDYLSRYHDVAIIPNDPYDVSVRLAKRLLHERATGLTTSQRATYRPTMSLSRERVPAVVAAGAGRRSAASAIT